MSRSEERLIEENSRLGSEITETKNAAMHQITELSNHVVAVQDELDRTKYELSAALEGEKHARNDVERVKKEIELLGQSREEMQQQLTLETASLRKELQDQRLKVKSYSESRQALEIELLNARTQLQKTEGDPPVFDQYISTPFVRPILSIHLLNTPTHINPPTHPPTHPLTHPTLTTQPPNHPLTLPKQTN